MQHIETIELDSSQASITFSSIPQDYDDLVVKLAVRSDDTTRSDMDILLYRINNDSGANYNMVQLSGTGSAVGSGSYNTLSSTDAGGAWGRLTAFGPNNATTTSNTFSNFEIYISNYTSTTNKSLSCDFVTENNATAGFQELVAGLYSTSSATTQLAFALFVGSFISGSTISLYGITAGGDGTVTSA